LKLRGVEPVFAKEDQVIDYAQNRACFRSGQVRIFDSTGNVERVIPFDDANRKL
jgi:methyl coenzyme M reductase alpha subunit